MCRVAYPPVLDYIDAQVKKASDKPEIHNEGLNQEADYFEKCLAVKETIPKS